MAHDEDFYEFATRFPRAALALAGISTAAEYHTESVEVKRSRRVDMLFRPADPADGPRVYLELQARHDPQVERRFLEEVVMHCVKEGSFEGVRGVVLYTERRLLDAVLAADVGDGDQPLVRFTPVRLVLQEQAPAALEAQGGEALIALPLVGAEDEVERRAASWHERIRESPDVPEANRQAALDYFCRLLADRLSTMDVSELLRGGERIMEDTVTGQRLIEKGIEKGVAKARREDVARVLEARFGAVGADVVARLAGIEDVDVLDRLLTDAVRSASVDAFRGRLPAR